MKLSTTFWSEQKHDFNKLIYINGNTKEIIFQTNLDDAFATYKFFKDIAKFVKSTKVLKTLDSDCYKQDFYQFAVSDEKEIIHIKWFDLIIDEKTTISHDIAFETTLIKKNNVIIPFGHFPMYYYRKNIQLPKYREFNVKARSYKYIANQVKKNLF